MTTKCLRKSKLYPRISVHLIAIASRLGSLPSLVNAIFASASQLSSGLCQSRSTLRYAGALLFYAYLNRCASSLSRCAAWPIRSLLCLYKAQLCQCSSGPFQSNEDPINADAIRCLPEAPQLFSGTMPIGAFLCLRRSWIIPTNLRFAGAVLLNPFTMMCVASPKQLKSNPRLFAPMPSLLCSPLCRCKSLLRTAIA